ncbi:InlB B-repeat-containing protein [Cohnella fermenti]|uniref:Uncharacterized protein n=1 Tax=Cohnella fermenti TaxID=2565925 RepID=A0A4S4BEA0_9BACL|nr:hypothetical protein E6C55_33565 [Cohnella fermenti]
MELTSTNRSRAYPKSRRKAGRRCCEWDFDGDTVSGDMTLYAHWTLNSYTVTFDPNGGSFSGSEVTVEICQG